MQEMSRFLTVSICIFATIALAEGTGRVYRWTVKSELTPPTGYKKLSITINGQNPGPTISAHQGDILIIDVTNGLAKDSVAIQWEGTRKNGEAVTQGPILPGKTSRFRFVANRVGNFQYRAISTLQKQAGMYGRIRVIIP